MKSTISIEKLGPNARGKDTIYSVFNSKNLNPEYDVQYNNVNYGATGLGLNENGEIDVSSQDKRWITKERVESKTMGAYGIKVEDEEEKKVDIQVKPLKDDTVFNLGSSGIEFKGGYLREIGVMIPDRTMDNPNKSAGVVQGMKKALQEMTTENGSTDMIGIAIIGTLTRPSFIKEEDCKSTSNFLKRNQITNPEEIVEIVTKLEFYQQQKVDMLKGAGFRVLTMPPTTEKDQELLQVLKTTPRFGQTQDNGDSVMEYSSQSDFARPVEFFIFDNVESLGDSHDLANVVVD